MPSASRAARSTSPRRSGWPPGGESRRVVDPPGPACYGSARCRASPPRSRSTSRPEGLHPLRRGLPAARAGHVGGHEPHGLPLSAAPRRLHRLRALLPSYVARGAMHTPAAIAWTKRILGEAFRVQLEGQGFSFVEILTMCPTDWYVEPSETPYWIEQNFMGTYPLRILKSP